MDGNNQGVIVPPSSKDEVARAAAVRAESAVANVNIGKDAIVSVPMNEAYAPNNDNYLNIPCYTGSSAVHPSVLYFPRGWNGYRYWMAFTPYEGTNNQVENPSVVCSHDGQTWVIPAGLTNPLALSPGNGGYNSDTVLFMDKDGVTMCLVYREFTPATKPQDEKFYLFKSKDGVNWGNRQLIHATNSDVARGVSPAILWNGTQYMMWYVDIKMSPKKLVLKTSPDLVNWSEGTNADLAADSGRQLWHIDVKEYQGTYYALLQDDVADGAPGYLYFAKSTDGIRWERSVDPIMRELKGTWQAGLYKSTFVPKITDTGLEFDVWYTGTSGQPPYKDWWKVAYSTIKFRNPSRASLDQKILYAIGKINPYEIGDTFDRADAAGLGTATTGQAWAASAGVFNLAAGYAVPSTNANTRSVTESSSPNCAVSSDVYFNAGDQAWLVGRFVDGNNYIRAGVANTGNVTIQRIQAGAATGLVTGNKAKSGDRIELVMVGDKLSLYVNEYLYCYINDSFNQSATQVGIQAATTTTKFNNFAVSRM